jgi:hypothetical protein
MSKRIFQDPPANLTAGKYMVQMIGGLEPEIMGPFKADEQRESAAKALHKSMDEDDNIFALDIGLVIDKGTLTLKPIAWCWSGGFFTEAEG